MNNSVVAPSSPLKPDLSDEIQAKIDDLNNLAWSLRFSDLQRGLALSQQVHELAKTLPEYRLGLVQSLRNLGYYHERLVNYDLALTFLGQALTLAEAINAQIEQATVLYIIGGLYWSRDDYVNALDYELKALQLSETINEPTCMARALNVIGLVHQSNGDMTKALNYFSQSLKLFEATNDYYGQGDVLSNLSEVYFDQGDYAQALDYGLKSLQIHNDANYVRDKGLVLITAGRAYLALHSFEQAMTCFQESLETSQQSENRFNQLMALVNLGNGYHQQGQSERALPFLHQAVVLAEEIGSQMELYQSHQLLSEVYEQQGDLKLALHHYKQFRTLKERVFNEETHQRYVGLQATYDSEAALRKAEIYQLKNVELEHEVLQRRQAEEKAQQRTTQLEALREVGLALTTELDLDTLLHTITTHAIGLLGATAGGLYLYQPEQDVVVSVVMIDSRGRLPGATLRRGEGVAGKVLETGQPVIVDDYEHWADGAVIFKGLNVSTVVGVPIWLGQEFLGVLDVAIRHTPFTATDVELLSLFATQAAVAIRNAQLMRSLQESEARYRAIVEDQIELICRFKPDGTTTFVNDAICRQHAQSRQALLGQNIFPLMPQPSREKVIRFVAACNPQNPINFDEQRVTTSDGKTQWLQWTDRAIFDEQGQVLEIQSVGRDVTALRSAQEALWKSEQRYRVISDLTSDYAYAFQVASDGRLILEWITDAFSRVTGFDLDEIATLQDWTALFHPDDVSGVIQRFRQVLHTGELDISEFRIVTKSGKVRWLRNYVRPIWDSEHNQVITLYGAAQDVTERKQTEAALRTSEQSYKELAEERSALYAETRKRLNYQTALSKAAAAISSSLELPTVLHHIAEQLGHALDATSTYISLYDEETKQNRVVAEYFSLAASTAERVSDLGISYYLPEDLPDLYAFLQSDQPALTQHHDDPNLAQPDRAHMIEYGVWSTLTIRLEQVGHIIGEASVWESRWRRNFTAAEVALCLSITQHAVIAIENARLYTEAQQHLKEQTALLEATRIISSTLDLPTLLNRIIEQMGQVVDATSAYICNYEREAMTSIVLAEYISPYACAGEKNSDLGVVYLLPQDLAGAWDFLQSNQTARVQHVDDPQTPASEQSHLREFGAQSTLLIRLGIGDETIGYAALWESRRQRNFTPEEIALCQNIAQQAAIAIKNARLLEQTRQDAETKAMLLQEANHRVKNNLSTIIGLLYAERRHTDMTESTAFQSVMQGLINRVQGLATAHSMLSATEWAPLSLCELTKQVIGSTLQALPPGKTVWVEVSPSPVQVAPQQANHLALVINELTVNTLKYALSEETAIRIMVRITCVQGVITLEFQNDGPGYPTDVLNSTRHSTGLYLIHSIVHKGLRGEVKLHNNPGATAILRFPSLIE